MPEENWIAHGGVPACDLCHARKVKCDRQEPCANCVVAKAECLRNRHKRAPRPKVRTDDKIQALVQRLSSLENSVRTTQRTPSITFDHDSIHLSPDSIEADASERPSKRMRTGTIPAETVPAKSPDNLDTTQQTTIEARHLISTELSTNGLLSVHQRSVLETAISFVDQLTHAPAPTITDRSTFDESMYGPTDITNGEILNVILGTEPKPFDGSTLHYQMVDHIPPKAVERIALALMEGTADEKTLNLYKIIIHFKAAVVLYANQLRGPKTPAVQKHIRQMEYDHIAAALTALDSVSVLSNSSLTLAQALVTGVRKCSSNRQILNGAYKFLIQQGLYPEDYIGLGLTSFTIDKYNAIMMQIMGNPVRCWELTAHASRTMVALGYHNITDTEPKNDLDREVHAVLAWCTSLDSCMSLLLLRPKSLPPLQIQVSSLVEVDPGNPQSYFEKMAMGIIPVYDKILELTLEPSGKRSATAMKAEVDLLRTQMTNIQNLLEKERPTKLIESNMNILLHWTSLEFKFYSTLTSVHRLSPSVTTNPSEREECLRGARKALECVKFIEGIGKSLGHFIEGYDPYLAWTMLSYPLCPFFVVFCNVVGTSDASDFQLLQDVTDGISTLVTENKYVNRLHRLCATLLGLCKPLVHSSGSNDMHAPPPGMVNPSSTYGQQSTFGTAPHVLDIAGGHNGNDVFLASSWNDDRMWQLFQSQPSLDWFNAEILDPAWGVSQPK